MALVVVSDRWRRFDSPSPITVSVSSRPSRTLAAVLGYGSFGRALRHGAREFQEAPCRSRDVGDRGRADRSTSMPVPSSSPIPFGPLSSTTGGTPEHASSVTRVSPFPNRNRPSGSILHMSPSSPSVLVMFHCSMFLGR